MSDLDKKAEAIYTDPKRISPDFNEIEYNVFQKDDLRKMLPERHRNEGENIGLGGTIPLFGLDNLLAKGLGSSSFFNFGFRFRAPEFQVTLKDTSKEKDGYGLLSLGAFAPFQFTFPKWNFFFGSKSYFQLRGDMDYSYIATLVFAVGSAVGWMLAIMIVAAINEKLKLIGNIPKGLQGPGIIMIISGIIALAFFGFSGMVDIK